MTCPADLLARLSPEMQEAARNGDLEALRAELSRLQAESNVIKTQARAKYDNFNYETPKRQEAKAVKESTESVWKGLATDQERVETDTDPTILDIQSSDNWLESVERKLDFIQENRAAYPNLRQSDLDKITQMLEEAADIEGAVVPASRKQVLSLRNRINQATERVYDRVAKRVIEQQQNDSFVEGVLNDLNKAFPEDEANTFRDVINAIINTVPHQKGQAEARSELVSDLIRKARNTDNYDAVTVEALRRSIDYFNEYATSDQYGTSSEALYLTNKLDAYYFDNLRKQYPDQLSSLHNRNVPFNPKKINDALQRRTKKPRSMLGMIPNLIDFFKWPILAKRIMPPDMPWTKVLSTGMKEFMDYRDQIDKAIHEQILPSLDPNTKDKGRDLYRENGAFLTEDLSKAPIHYLRDKRTGRLPSNIITAIAAETMTWASTQGGATAWNDVSAIQRLLGHDNAYDVSTVARVALHDAGMARGELINRMGRNSVRHLNLGTHPLSTADGHFEDRLAQSLGLIGVEALVKSGYATTKKIPGNLFEHYKKTYRELKQNPSPSTSTDTPAFVGIRIKTKKGDDGFPVAADNIVNLTNSWKKVASLFDRMFDVRDAQRPPATQEDKDAGKTDIVEKNIRRSNMEVDPTSAKNQRALQNRAVDYDPRVEAVIKAFDPQTFKEQIMDWKDPDTVNVTERDSQIGKNRGIDKEIDTLMDAYASGSPTQYFMYALQRNMRLRVDSNTINYQSNKGLQRIALFSKNWLTKIPKSDVAKYAKAAASGKTSDFADLPDSLVQYFNAAAFALDVKSHIDGDPTLPKMGVDKAVQDENFWQAVHNAMADPDGEFRPAINIFKEWDGQRPFTQEEMETIGAATQEAGERGWSMMMLDSWANLEKAAEQGTEFETRMPMEVDGLTNGLAIVLMQLPDMFTPGNEASAWERLARVGVFPEGDFTSFAEYKASFPKTQDFYEDLSSRVQLSINGLINDDANDVGVSAAFYDDVQGRSGQFELPRNTFSFMLRRFLSISDQGIKNPTEDKFLPFELGRNFAKDPFMQLAVYAAGAESVKGLVSVKSNYGIAPEEQFTKKMMKIASSDLDERTRAGLINKMIQNVADAVAPIDFKQVGLYPKNQRLTKQQNLGQWKFNKEYSALMDVPSVDDILNEYKNKEGVTDPVFEFARNYMIPRKSKEEKYTSPIQALQARAAATYGQSAANNAEQMTVRQGLVRDDIQIGAEFLTKAYQTMFDRKVADYMDENDGVPPDPQKEREIKQELIDDGWGANVAQVNSELDDYRTYLEIPAEEDTDLFQHYTEQGQVNAADTAKTQIGVKDKSSTGEGSLTSNIRRDRPNPDIIGVGTFVRLIHQMDAAIIGEIFSNHDVMHVFDAYLTGTATTQEVTQAANKAFIEVNEKYSVVQAMRNRVEQVQKQLEDSTYLDDTEKAEIREYPFTSTDDHPVRIDRKERYPDFDTWFTDSGDTAKEVADTRTMLQDEIKYVNQFSLDKQHHTQPGPKTLAADIMADLGSSPERPSRDYEQLFSSTLQHETARQILDKLKEYENVDIDPAHQEQLDNLMELVILPGLKDIDDIIEFNVGLNPNGSVNRAEIQGNEIYLEAAGNRLTAINMGLQESAIHEFTHAVLYPFIQNDPEARTELENLFERAREVVEPYHFLPEGTPWVMASDTEKAIAQQRYDYIFNNPGGNRLHEFAAIGLTNKPFADALAEIDYRTPDQLREELTSWDTWKSNPLKQLWNIFERALEWIGGRKYETRRQNVKDALLNLSRNMITINTQERTRVGDLTGKKWADAAQRMNEFLPDRIRRSWVGHALGRKVDSAYAKRVTDTMFGDTEPNQAEIVGYPGGTFSGAVKKAGEMMGESWRDMGFPEMKFARNLVREVTGNKKEDLKRWRNLRRQATNMIDVFRKRTYDRVQQMIADAFGRKLTDSEWRAINDAVLRTDFSVLAGSYAVPRMIDFLTDSAALETEIRDLETQLKRTYGSNGIAYVNQSKNLGLLISKGQTYSAVQMPQLNAHNIANLYMLPEGKRKPTGDLDAAEETIDILTTLYALRSTDVALKQEAAQVFREEAQRGEWNGMTGMLAHHAAFKQESLAKNFEGNKLSIRKGYTQEKLDSNIKVAYEPVTDQDQERMKAQGYTLVGRTNRDPLHKKVMRNEPPIGIYINKMGLGRWRGQITSLTSQQNAGTDLISALENQLGLAGTALAENRISRLTDMAYKGAEAQFKEGLDTETVGLSSLVPILSSTTGAPVNYRYMMSDRNKQELMGREDKAHENLGRMFGNVYDKVNTRKINREVVDNLHEEWLALRDDPSAKYRYIGLDSGNQADIDAFRMLPEDMRYYGQQKFGRKGIYVRDDMYNYIIGFREVSVADKIHQYQLKNAGSMPAKVPINVLHSLRVAEDIWKEIIQFARVKTSVLLPEVVMGNFYSNYLVLAADGIPPNYILKMSRQGLQQGRKYQKQRARLESIRDEIAAKEMAGIDTTKLRAEQASLFQDTTANPVHEIIQEGLFQTIVEDVNPEAFQTQGSQPIQEFLEKQREKYVSKFGVSDKVVTVAKEVTMMPGSRTFAAAMAANQYGDFVARYVKFRYDIDVRKRDRQEAIDDSLDYFVYYDEPSDPYLEAANQYGVFLFWKFYARIQRIAFRLFAEKPATATMVAVTDKILMDDYIDNYLGNVEKAWNRLDIIPDPIENISKATDMPIFEWAKMVIPGV